MQCHRCILSPNLLRARLTFHRLMQHDRYYISNQRLGPRYGFPFVNGLGVIRCSWCGSHSSSRVVALVMVLLRKNCATRLQKSFLYRLVTIGSISRYGHFWILWVLCERRQSVLLFSHFHFHEDSLPSSSLCVTNHMGGKPVTYDVLSTPAVDGK